MSVNNISNGSFQSNAATHARDEIVKGASNGIGDAIGVSVDFNSLQLQLRRLELSRDLAREFIKTTDMKKLMAIIFKRVLEVLEAEAGSLWMIDWRTKENICHLAEGPAKERIIGMRLPAGKGIVGSVIQTKTPQVVLDCSKDERFASQIDSKTGFITRSMICVPLVVDNYVYGAIQIINKKSAHDQRFTEEDRELVQDLAINAAISIKNARLIESESKVREMTTLMRISREISASLDLDHVMASMVNMANELIDVSKGAFSLMDEDKNALSLSMLSGGEKVDKKDERQKEMLSLMEQVRSADRTVYIPDIDAYRKQCGEKRGAWLEYMEKWGVVSIWSTPLKDEEGTLGVIWFEGGQRGFASGSKADLLNILASQATVAVRNASLYQRVPFAETLASIGEKGKFFFTAWRKWAAAAIIIVSISLSLHYFPVFRSVSGDCIVEAGLGQGIFLEVGGRVKKVKAREGDEVRSGDVLVELDDSELLLRKKEIMTKLSIIERRIVEAKAREDAPLLQELYIKKALFKERLSRALEDIKRTVIRAPFDGIVLTPDVEELEGKVMPIGAEVMRLSEKDRLRVVVSIPEDSLSYIWPGRRVVGAVKSAPGREFEGRVIYVGRSYLDPAGILIGGGLSQGNKANSSAGGFIAEVSVDKSDVRLRPGMSGRAKIMLPEVSFMTRLINKVKTFIEMRLFW